MFKNFIVWLFKIKPFVLIAVVREKKVSNEARLDNDPKFSDYTAWAGKMAIQHPGRDGVDG